MTVTGAGDGVLLRTAGPDDADGCVRVFVRAWKGGYRDVLPAPVLDGLDEATAAGWMRPPGSDPAMTTTVAVVEGRIRGFIRYGSDPDDPSPGTGYVAALYVDPAAGGRGIGRLLLRHAVAELGTAHRHRVTLWVFEANDRARALYASAGFHPDGGRLVDPRWQVPQVRLVREA